MANQEEVRSVPQSKACFYCGHTGGEHVPRDRQTLACQHPGCDCAFFTEGR